MDRFKEIADLIEKEMPDLFAIYLFGSIASGTSNEESDIDLALLAKGPIAADKLSQVKIILYGKINYPSIDVVDMRTCPTTLAIEVLHGVVILDRAPRERAEFEARLLSQYAILNEERKEILEDIRKRGSVYGG